jgi:2-C-methyl-D-erythritol 4-phosphate cytidylyltransferase/2-C-methyl-D-erythritol 2,4-cyclodiphosphate synthase
MDNKPPMSDLHAKPRIAALIVAAGRGTRSGRQIPKQYVAIGGEPVLRRTIRAFLASPLVDLVQVVIHPQDRAHYDAAVKGLAGLAPPVDGDISRQLSVLRGLEALQAEAPSIVLIHDGARPFISGGLIGRIIAEAGPDRGVVPALAITDTLRRAEDGKLAETVSRERLHAMQTPQCFPYPAILDAHREALAAQRTDLGDDAAVFMLAGKTVTHVAGERDNIKLTEPDDFAYAETMMSAASETRTGQGFDVHAFEAGDAITLCGIEIPFDRRLKGHSDADVGLHALTDAIFGAMADGDIGSHFPPSDPQWKDRSSDHFLQFAMSRLEVRGGRLVSLDLTLVCEMPKIGPRRDAMRARVSEICGIDADRVSIKATTSERLGFTGRGEGIAALAVATIELPAEI